MNKLKVLFLTLLLAAFSAPISAKIVVLNAEVAMLSTQFAQEAFNTLDEDSGFIADRERLELLQAEGQAEGPGGQGKNHASTPSEPQH